MPHLTGSALRTPFGDLAATWRALVAGHGAVSPLPDDLLDDLTALGRTALAGATPELVVLAATKGDTGQWLDALCADAASPRGDPGWLARELGQRFACPAVAISAACASGTAALGVAARRLRLGRLRHVLVLGGDRPHAFINAGFTALRALDPSGCRPYSVDRAGLALGEARAALVLSRDGDGPWLSGWGGACDANHLTGPDREGRGLAAAARAALHGRSPAVIIGHGTGTRFNDDAESLAWAAVAPGVPVTGSKGLLGHTLGAAGVVDALLAAEACRRGRIFGLAATATVGCAAPLRVLTAGEHPCAGAVLVANAGFGGLNHALYIGDGPPPEVTAGRCHSAAEVPDLAVAGHLPPLSAREVLGRVDVGWGRLDLASRAVVAATLRLGAVESATAQVLVTRTGCAVSDRLFERSRRAGRADPQRFPYTLPSTPLGEASIRANLRGPAMTLLDPPTSLAAAIVDDVLTEVPVVIVTHCDSDAAPQHAQAALRRSSRV